MVNDMEKLTGRIPTELGAMPNLTTLVMYDNRLSGPIPSELGRLKRLTLLNLSGRCRLVSA